MVDTEVRERIQALAIPPAWDDTRIAAHARAHIQAVGRDEKGRVQYIYHADWERLREQRKAARLAVFTAALRDVRDVVAKDLKRAVGERRAALAAGVALIDEAAIRVGSDVHLRKTGARGAVTLSPANVNTDGKVVALRFKGKGGKIIETAVEAPRLARTLLRLKRLEAPRLLSYRREDGSLAGITAQELNRYLQEISGARISAKDFRTFHATALALDRLSALEPDPSDRKRNSQIVAVTREVSELLGNTPTIARKSYVLVEVLEQFVEGSLVGAARQRGRLPRNLKPHEAALARFFAAKAARKRGHGQDD